MPVFNLDAQALVSRHAKRELRSRRSFSPLDHTTRPSVRTRRFAWRVYGSILCAGLPLVVSAQGVGTPSSVAPVTPEPLPERVVADASFQNYHGIHIMLPVTIHGHTETIVIDLGADAPVVLTSAATSLLNVPHTDVLDSLTIGTTVKTHVDLLLWEDMMAPPPAPPTGQRAMIGLIGTQVIADFDLLFDGPAHRVRLYQPVPASNQSSGSARAAWLPPGLTMADCLPLEPTLLGNPDDHWVKFTVRFNGHPFPALFDAGAPTTAMNVAAAKIVGITQRTPGIQILSPDQAGYLPYVGAGAQKTYHLDGVTLQAGAHRLADTSIDIVTNYPVSEPVIGLGLSAIADRLFFVSYSTKQVCFGAPHGAAPHN